MKKLIIPFLLVMALAFQACEETQSPIYDGSQTLAYFNGTSATLEVEINSTGQVDIPVGVSTLSSSDRSVAVSVNTAGTTATAGQYSFSGTATIPANSYTGSFTLTGMDDGLTTDGVTLTLQIDGVDGGVGSPRTYAVNIVEICPIDASFAVGDYTVTWLSGGIPAAGFAPFLGNGETVTLEVGDSSTERKFRSKVYPTFPFGNVMTWSFGMVCEEVVSKDQLETEGSGVSFNTTPDAVGFAGIGGGTYSTASDATITIVYREDFDGLSCGTEGVSTIQLTKQ